MKSSITLIVFILFSIFTFSQSDLKIFDKKSEIYFTFIVKEKSEINILTKIISIDNVKGNIVYAYANKEEFSQFLKLGYEYEILKSPGDVGDVHMSKFSKEVEAQVNSVSFSLEQNYPNPFNPSTKIKFSLPEKSYVKISVIDILGNQVSILKTEEIDSGFHELTFDGSKFSSGIYYYLLETNNFHSVKKMILL